MSLSCDFAAATPVKILRDTGSSQSLILVDTLSVCDETSSGTNVLIQGVDYEYSSVPLHEIYLKSGLISGKVSIGVKTSSF